MPDITMCVNKACPLADACYRFTATPDKHRQSYAGFAYKTEFYDRDGYSEMDITCDYFIDNSPYKAENSR
jgi:hypothetical protein